MPLDNLQTRGCAAIAVDCLNTFMKGDGKLSISAFQAHAKGRDKDSVQRELDEIAKQAGDLRRYLHGRGIPQIQFQDAHVVESIHGKRFHSLELVREGQAPDFMRRFPPHALLEKNRRFGTPDQQSVPELDLPDARKILIRWFDTQMPPEASLEASKELVFLKDDFCMCPGTPFVHQLFWELRRQGRFDLIVFGVCDEICNLRNVILMLSCIFNVVYVDDCTYPLDPDKRDAALKYMSEFNPLGQGSTGQFARISAKELIRRIENSD